MTTDASSGQENDDASGSGTGSEEEDDWDGLQAQAQQQQQAPNGRAWHPDDIEGQPPTAVQRRARRRSSGKRRSGSSGRGTVPAFLALTAGRPAGTSKRPSSREASRADGLMAQSSEATAALPTVSSASASAIGMANEQTPLLTSGDASTTDPYGASSGHITPPHADATAQPAGQGGDGLRVGSGSSFYGSSPPDGVPFPRKSSFLRKKKDGMEALITERRSGMGTIANGMRQRDRRRSSAHAGSRPRMQQVGSSTSGQTLFNAINVLVGVGILAQRAPCLLSEVLAQLTDAASAPLVQPLHSLRLAGWEASSSFYSAHSSPTIQQRSSHASWPTICISTLMLTSAQRPSVRPQETSSTCSSASRYQRSGEQVLSIARRAAEAQADKGKFPDH